MRRERRFVVMERAACKFFVAALPTEIGLDDGEPMPILRRLVSCVAEQSNSAGKQRRTFVSRYWFLAMLLMMIPAGLWLPGGGRAIKDAGWLTPVLVGVMMAVSGFTLDTGKLHRQAANLGAISLLGPDAPTRREAAAQLALERRMRPTPEEREARAEREAAAAAAAAHEPAQEAAAMEVG